MDNCEQGTASFIEIESLLRTVEEAKKGLDYEVGTLISRNGVVLKEYHGGAHYISTPEADLPLFEGNIFTHNHPSGRCFTQEDILRFIRDRLREVRVSTPKGIVFSLKEGEGEINRSIANVMKEENIGSYIHAAHLMNERQLDLTGTEYQVKLFDIMGNEVDEWLTQNAQEFGYIYSKGEL
ncbi:MAG: hypothetical protein LBR76_04970 [Oscillospiraceae bacterium]|jgi:hypothetical protein|nr:hypothetical protein [Oscillospiraceae bacterium]